jgi:GAF domain-containing protein
MDDIVVLIVDQDDETRQETATYVENELPEATVLLAGTKTAAMDLVAERAVDVLVTGYNLEDETGLELVSDVREYSSEIGCILFTQAETVDTESFEEVVVEFVGKDAPDAMAELTALIQQAGTELTQSAYPVSDDEAQRIDAATDILDRQDRLTEPFDRIATLARTHFDARASAVTIILRDRQEQLGMAGPQVAPTEREASLATHTLVQDDGVMMVTDTQDDPRFEDIETIQSAGITSYLGAVVHSPGGSVVGVLSVYDDEQRDFTPADQEYLELVAELSSDVLALETGGDQA